MNRSDQQWTLSQINTALDSHTHTHQSHVASHATGQITRLQSPRLMTGYPRTSDDTWTCVWTLKPEHTINWRQDEHVIGLGNWAYDQHARTTISAPSLNQRGGPDTDHFAAHPDDRLVNHVDRFTRHDQQLCWLDQHTLDHNQSAQHVTHQVTRAHSLDHASFIGARDGGTLDVHWWWRRDRLHVQLINRGVWRPPHPRLSYNHTYRTWLNTADDVGEHTHDGLIPYLFRDGAATDITPEDREDPVKCWTLPATSTSRVIHNMCLVPRHISWFTTGHGGVLGHEHADTRVPNWW